MTHTKDCSVYKRVLSVFLALALCLTLIPMGAWAADNIFDGGSGTEDDPYLISSAEQFEEIANDSDLLSGCFLLTADIDLDGNIVTFSTFSGTFDGGGHTISGIYAYKNGLFGTISEEGTVRNLCVDGRIYSSYGNGGGFAGTNHGTIENCVNKATSTNSSYSHVGGIAARNHGIIRNCLNLAYIYNNGDSTGGIAAYNEGVIENCCNYGTVVGVARSGNVTVESTNNGDVENCYYLEDGVYKSYDDPETELTAAQLAKALGEDSWAVDMDGNIVLTAVTDAPYSNGDENEFIISNPAAFKSFRDYINAGNTGEDMIFTLTEDIDLGCGKNDQWEPIGSDSVFSGEFDGGGHTVSGLYIDSGNGSQGLFGCVKGGKIHDLTVDGSVKGGNTVGGVAAYLIEGEITNCSNSGTVRGEDGVGGVVGYIDDSSTVTNCFNAGNVSGTGYVGGVIGNVYSTVTNCHNTGEVSGDVGSAYIGGVVGMIVDGTVTECGNSGKVSCEGFNIGGIAGYCNAGSMANCYNTGNVYGDSNVGGVLGCTFGTTMNCYNTGAVQGINCIGGVFGNNCAPAANCYNVGAVTGTNYVGGVVGLDGGGEEKNCYYLDTTAESGFGNDEDLSGAEDKTEAEFNSGEVAYLLQGGQKEQVWYQNISTRPVDAYPVLKGDDSTIVEKIDFVNPAVYTNPGHDATVPDGSVVTPPGSDTEITVGKNGDKTTVDKDGNITVPKGGSVEIGETTVTYPDGGTVETDENGDVLIPGDAGVRIGDTDVTLPDGGTVNADGDVSIPKGGRFEIGDTVVTFPDGGAIETDEDGSLILPEGSTVTKDGKTTTVPRGGAKLDPDSEELTLLERPGTDESDNGSDEVTAEGLPDNMTIKVTEVSENSEIAKFLQNDPEWKLVKCYNVDLFQGETQIYKLDSNIRLRFDIPEELRANGREFAVLRLHGSSAEILYDIDQSSDTVTVETDRFSVYALVYRDAAASEPGVGDDTDSNHNPDTGRPIAGVAIIVLAGVAGFVAVTAKRKKAK